MRKIVWFFGVLLYLFFLPDKAFAQENFLIDSSVEYNINEYGLTTVTHNISLENAISTIYATSYSLSLSGIEPQNPRASQGTKELELIEKISDSGVDLEVKLEDPVVGKGKSQTFTLVFEDSSFANKTGEVWEVSVPRLLSPENFRTYKLNLLVPKSFGEMAFISPEPILESTEEDNNVYVFNKEDIAGSGVSAGFGNFQVFSFSLSYHLENPLGKQAYTQIAIPPDTSFQKVFYDSIDPQPENVYVDGDGNWLASYKLKSRERLDVSAAGSVQLFASPRPFPAPSKETLEVNKVPTEYWQSSNEKIISLAKTYDTPRKIYDFVTNYLTYDYDRVRPNVERLGALRALENPNNAICMEFTDLFIAIARAANIPAREVNGYAYSENPELQPLSLVADVLHAWPEYWNFDKNVWIPVDPTWGSTSAGVDYFSKLDLRHFSFVHHGADSSQPYPPGSYKLGPNPQKDVFVNFGKLPELKASNAQIFAESNKGLIFTGMNVEVLIKNPGPVALYDFEPIVLFDDKKVYSSHIDILPPYSSYALTTKVPFSFLGRNTPAEVLILAGKERLTIQTFKTQVLIYNLIAIFLAFFIIALVTFLRVRHTSLRNLLSKVLIKFKSKNNNEPQQT